MLIAVMNNSYFPQKTMEKWIKTLDLIAEILEADSVSIIKYTGETPSVLAADTSGKTPFTKGASVPEKYLPFFLEIREKLNSSSTGEKEQTGSLTIPGGKEVNILAYPLMETGDGIQRIICACGEKGRNFTATNTKVLAHFSEEMSTDLSLLMNELKYEEVLKEDREHKKDQEIANQFLESIFSYTPLMIAYMDADFNFIRVNRSYAAQEGKEPDYFIGKNHFDLFPYKENESIFRNVVESGIPYHAFAKEFIYADNPERGRTFWDWSLVPVSDINGKVEALIFLLVDVTERTRTQREYERLATVIEQSEVTVVMTDLDANIIYANPAFEKTTGYRVEEAMGQNPRILQGKNYEPEFFKELWNTISNGETWNGVFVNRRKDGSLYHEDAVIFPIKDRDGNIFNYAAVKQDVSKRVLARTNLEKALSEKNVLLKELYHRTKNNMQVISAMMTLQSIYYNDSNLSEAFETMKNRIHSMSLVHQKLYETENLSKINLKEYITDMAENLVETRKYGGGNISLDLDLRDTFVLIDIAVPCGLILNELISNCLKHAFTYTSSGTISISLEENSSRVIKITVKDNGKGFPEGFEPGKSSSMGMELIHSIAMEQLSGTIRFESQKGTSCTLELKNNIYDQREQNIPG